MKFHWADGYSRDFTVMHKMCGIQHESKGPESASFTGSDIAEILREGEKGQFWLKHLVFALSK